VARWRPWFWSLALVVTTLLLLTVRERPDKAHVALVYVLLVRGPRAGGRTVGIAVGGAFVAFNYWFLPPIRS
jgi:hypothetical protein